jgi:hypothetical protein
MLPTVFVKNTSWKGSSGEPIKITKPESARRKRNGHYHGEGVERDLEFLFERIKYSLWIYFLKFIGLGARLWPTNIAETSKNINNEFDQLTSV